ncbi:peptidase C13 [Rhodanobacter denitrificans]|uniref:Peptidase C13 n=1 Tax=Rhodanobacter denitrificans TaxID=666685 RepID=A0A368KDK8_9GAMM|nr:C13 family peptidase [Rhodanobacter denitrificans]RCS29999.1 peptidase C13 [Rhodanobacter denitrificans]
MRHALTILLAFAAGVLLALWWPVHRPTPVVGDHPALATPASVEPADSSAGVALDNWPTQGPTPEQILYAQPRMMREALSGLGPRVPGKPNLYLLAFAGDGGEDVFRNEAEYAAQLFAQRFGASAHSLVLENNPATLTTRPLASWSNLETALEGLGKTMQPEQDILLLYLTSHGDEEHNLLLDMDPLPLDQLGASDLAGILAMHPFKWKVLVVNACYSGGFVPPLRGPGTLVLTAARADRSSFGCGSDSDITYFGRAWLVDALNHTDNFADAFKRASGEISQWERQDKLTPSEPQIDVGSGITTQLALWRKGITPGPAVPFKPALPAASASAATPR